jgi:hypothetical protein
VKEDLALPQHLPLDGLRLFHLHDHLGRGEDFGRRSNDRGARLAVRVVVHADALAGRCARRSPVAVRGELAHAAGHEADAVFEDLDLFGNADAHGIVRTVVFQDGS